MNEQNKILNYIIENKLQILDLTYQENQILYGHFKKDEVVIYLHLEEDEDLKINLDSFKELFNLRYQNLRFSSIRPKS